MRLWKRLIWVLGCLLVGVSVTTSASAQGQLQVSDQFKRVSREVAKRFLTDALTDSCKRSNNTVDPVCEALVDSLIPLFESALDGKLNGDNLAADLRDQLIKTARAAAVDLAATELEKLLASLPAADATCSAKGLGEPIIQCLSWKLYKSATKSQCDAADKAIRATLKRCGVTPPTAPLSVEELIDQVRQVLADKKLYGASMVLAQVLKVVRGSDGSLYGIARQIADANESLLRNWSRIDDAPAFAAADVNAVLDAPTDNCSNAAAVRGQATAWNGKRAHLHAVVARALSRFQPLPDVSALPDTLGDPGCASATAPLTKAAKDLEYRARVVETDAKITSVVQRAVVPTLLIALLVDYISTRDDQQLLQNVRELSLLLLARGIAAFDAENSFIDCRRNETAVICPLPGGKEVELPAKTLSTVADPADFLEDLEKFIEARRTLESARHNCIYQSVSVALRGSYEVQLPDAPQLCTLSSKLLANTVFADYLEPVVPAKAKPTPAAGAAAPTTAAAEPAPDPAMPSLMQWKSSELVHMAVKTRSSLKFASTITLQSGYEMLSTLLPALTNDIGGGAPEFQALGKALSSFQDGLTDQGRRELLLQAILAFKPRLTEYLDKRVAALASCQDKESSKNVRCAVRILTDAAYEPLFSAIVTGAPEGGSGKLARQLYRQLDALDPLGNTPLLFNIGPGATVLSRFDSKDPTVHLTLLDKFGLARRCGDRNQWEVGVFAGGFVDAIIRAAADGGEEPYWLLGTTFGYRQFSRRYPFGFELYLGAALPFSTKQIDDKAAAAAGLNLIVPAEMAFTENE